MAYNNYYNPYSANMPHYQPMQQQPQPQILNGGYVSVRSEEEARAYPVAPGNSVTFINELAPYQYKKTMGFSQFERPIFEKFRVIKEEAEISPTIDEKTKATNDIPYALKSDIEQLQATLEALQNETKSLKDKIGNFEIKKSTNKSKKEDEE